MKKVTENTANAFISRKTFSSGNTVVHAENNSVSCFLHGNKIAFLTGNLLSVSSCGWKTSATKERLNGIFSGFKLPRITQKDFTWYIDGKPFEDGTTFKI